jgi:type II secretory pathway pseudopilin PulG
MQRNSAGFTLVEVVVATGILITVAAGTAQLFGIAIRHDLQSRRQLAMAAAAAAKIEELAGSIAVAAAPSSASGALDRADDGYSDNVAIAGFALQRRWIVAPIASAPRAVTLVVRVVAAGSADDYEIATIAEGRTP